MKYKVKKSDPGLNLAPLIDVVFLLLIFFIVASTLNMNQVKTGIDLPDTSSQGNQPSQEITISLTESGQLYLGQKELNLKELPAAVKKLIEKTKTGEVIIYADKGVDFEKVVKVMDALRLPELKNLGFALRQD